jgi:hypothetical protein
VRFLRWFIFIIPLTILVGTPLTAALIVLEHTPVVVKQGGATAADVSRARTLARQIIDKILNTSKRSELVLSQKDFNSLSALAARASPQLSGTMTTNHLGLSAAITFQIPQNPFGKYVNLQFGLAPSPTGLNVSHASIGRLKVSGRTAVTVIRNGMNLILGNDEGTLFFNAIRSTNFANKKMTLLFEPVPDLKGRLQKISKRLGDVRDQVALLGDPRTIQIYYAKLVEIDSNLAGIRSISLANFMGPLFQTAKDRSNSGDPVTENQAALLALVIYFGDARFERLTGKVRTDTLISHKPKTKNVRLAGRGDLLLHFLISAGLKIVSDSGVSATIGEFKELLDSDGGSGFSFVDLAADKAGIRFAEVATSSKKRALHLQSIIAGETTEQTFFPDITGLPEGINDKDFKKLFGSVDSETYKSMVQKIDDRIAEKSVYKHF